MKKSALPNPLSNACPKCKARAGVGCAETVKGKVRFVESHIDRHSYSGDNYVRFPVNPNHEILMFLAGDPVILAASDEKMAREFWGALIERAGK